MLGQRTERDNAPDMEIPLRQRLSFKQAGLTVLVAFILGALLSLVQIGVDYASEDAAINREIRALMEISHNPCLLYTSPSPRDLSTSRMPSSA